MKLDIESMIPSLQFCNGLPVVCSVMACVYIVEHVVFYKFRANLNTLIPVFLCLGVDFWSFLERVFGASLWSESLERAFGAKKSVRGEIARG